MGKRIKMAQMNINMTPDFADSLNRFMRLRGIRSKSEAVRIAVREGLERALSKGAQTDFREWIGAGTRAPQRSRRRFRSEDDIWG